MAAAIRSVACGSPARAETAPGPARLLLWDLGARRTRVLFGVLFALCAWYAIGIGVGIVIHLRGAPAAAVGGLSLFWSWSEFLHSMVPAASIYNRHVLYAFERAAFGATSENPFAYPPTTLLVVWPLALLRARLALSLWLGAGALGFALACRHRPRSGLTMLCALVVPSTLACLCYGQISLVVAACLIGGFRLLGRRPVLAGVLFGLAVVKPQFGLLVPVALVSARQWRALAAATTTVALGVVASGLAFGWGAWARLPAAMAGLGRFVSLHPAFLRLCPTVAAATHLLGAGPLLAGLVQGMAALLVVVVVWRCFRPGVTPLAVAALLVGTFLVTPYALFYDLPMVSYAVLAVVLERHQAHAPFATDELLLLILVMALPELMLFGLLGAPWGMAGLVLFFMTILRRIAVTTRLAAS